jgi:steroid 5-alpha reductase family enzyme
MTVTRIAAPIAAAGLFAGALAWAFQQQASYIVASISCAGAEPKLWIIAALALLLLAAGLAVSLHAARKLQEERAPGEDSRPRRLLAQVGTMAAAIFLFAILLQIAAFFFLPVCIA